MQLNINYIPQLSKKKYKWCKNYLYDFYLPDYKLIIEMDGGFHNKVHSFSNLTIEDVIFSDTEKEKIALENGIYVIRIDCDYKNEGLKFEFFKQQIEKSHISNIFDLNVIDWKRCVNVAKSSKVVEICNYYNNVSKLTKDIACHFKLDRTTVIGYLKQGKTLNLCDYDSTLAYLEGVRRVGKTDCCNKKVEVFDLNGVSCGVFGSVTKLCEVSESLFGVKFSISKISSVANNKRNHHRNYIFKYVNL